MREVNQKLYPLRQAQEQLGISRTALWQLRRDGEIEEVLIGRKPLIPGESIDAYIARLREQASRGAV